MNTRTSPPQVAFSSGELDPLLHRRFDYQRFQTGLAACRGFLPLAQGGFTRAPGTIFRGYTKALPAVLIPFQFAENDALILEFTAYAMRVWRYGNQIMAGAVPYEIATPFSAEDLPNLRWVQSADVIYLCSGTLPIQKLARRALNDWTIGAVEYDTGPFRVQNLRKGRTLQASATTGTITLTASFNLFTPQHVGSLIRLVPTDYTTIPLFTTYEAVTVGDRRRYDQNVYELTMRLAADVGQNPPIHSEGEALTDNNTKWKFISDSEGTVRITAVASATSATAEVLKSVPEACVASPTYRWSEGAWSDVYGYPSEIELFEQRLCAAATPSEPRTVWFSAVGDYSDFSPGVEADQSFAYTIAGDGSINRIVSLCRGSSGLHIFALGEEYSTRADTRSQVIGPTNAVFGLDGTVGSSTARPISPAGNPIFISRDKGRVMEVAYSLQADANQLRPLSRIAEHLGAERFEQIVWQSAPSPTAWLRRASGDLVAMIYDAAEEVLGWAPLSIAGGHAVSLAVCPNDTGTADVLTIVARRTINGIERGMIEDQAPVYGILNGAQPISEACHLFASSVFIRDPAESIFHVPHLVGQDVYAWTDKGEFGPLVVAADGSVTLPTVVKRATIGLFDPTHFVETLDIQAAAPDGNSMGRQKRLLSSIKIGLHRTAALQVSSVERAFAEDPIENSRSQVIPRSVAAVLTDGFTGLAKIDAPTGLSSEVSLRIYPWSGAPATVTAIIPTIQEGGR